jgi:hypothetical protein
MESGRVKVDQMKRQYDFEIKNANVIATANDLNGLSKPLQSRFSTMDQFLQVAVKVCPKLSEETALMIGEETWRQQGDIRDVISVSKLVKKHDGLEEIAEILKTLAKYGGERVGT